MSTPTSTIPVIDIDKSPPKFIRENNGFIKLTYRTIGERLWVGRQVTLK